MKMIPEFIEESAPPGEVKVFRKFQSAVRDWVVIHSLDLAPYNRLRRTEIDFVVLIPSVGILCIEVKSHQEIGFDGSWYPKSIKKSPFNQAQDARFALHRRIKEQLPLLVQVPVLHCCIFPSAYFPVPRNLTIQPFEVMDKKRFEEHRNSEDFCDAIEKMALLAIKHDPQLGSIKVSLSKSQIDEFINFCFPIRVRRPEKALEQEHREQELSDMLRVQQLPIITLTEYNSRILVEGGAGTGKTLIGLAVARRKAEQGYRVGYLCFNQLIGKWIKREVKTDQNPLLIAGSAYAVMMALLNIPYPKESNKKFWDELPFIIQDHLTDPESQQDSYFDYLVIDEAQDILTRPELMTCLDMLVDGGFKAGRYLILGDFKNQVLSNNSNLEQALDNVRSVSTKWLLTENCRNYKAIGQVAMTLSMADKDTYSGYMRNGGGIYNWEITYYNKKSEQLNTINKFIKKVLSDEFSPEKISLLSFGNTATSIIHELKKHTDYQFTPAGMFDSSGIKYSTISSYKGLESKVIIITDVSPNDSGFDRSLFYTGLTRATEQVLILCNESGKTTLGKWIRKANITNE